MKTYTLLGRGRTAPAVAHPRHPGRTPAQQVYGRLDCPTALRWIAKGQYVQHRVFFADEETAVAAGYRPCGHCLRERYREWLAG